MTLALVSTTYHYPLPLLESVFSTRPPIPAILSSYVQLDFFLPDRLNLNCFQVPENRLEEALSLLGDAGFDLYDDDPERLGVSQMSSPPLSPVSDRAHDHPSSAVLTRTRSSTNTSLGSVMSQAENLSQPTETQSGTPPKPRAHSPTGHVELLPSSLACVGLSDTERESWTLKIFKLVCFPDLINVGVASGSADTTRKERALPPTPPPVDLVDDAHATNGKPPVRPTVSIPDQFPVELEAAQKVISPRRPFLSFTTSPDGSSLITDVSELASLFPPSERHLVKNGGELDFDDFRRSGSSDLSSCENDSDDITLQCLQIDLQKFGLGMSIGCRVSQYFLTCFTDKHGLVNRFSSVLGEHHIDHLYSSTYKTANLLVSPPLFTAMQIILVFM